MKTPGIAFIIVTIVLCGRANAQYHSAYFSNKLNILTTRIEDQRKAIGIRGAPAGGANEVSTQTAAAADQKSISDEEARILNEQIGECQTTMAAMATEAKGQAKRSEKWALFGATAGLLGSVASGHASTIVVGLLSGVSGLSNSAQQVYKENGDTPQATLKTRADMRQDAIAAVTQYTSAQDDSQRLAALTKLHVACTMFAMTIDQPLPAAGTK